MVSLQCARHDEMARALCAVDDRMSVAPSIPSHTPHACPSLRNRRAAQRMVMNDAQCAQAAGVCNNTRFAAVAAIDQRVVGHWLTGAG